MCAGGGDGRAADSTGAEDASRVGAEDGAGAGRAAHGDTAAHRAAARSGTAARADPEPWPKYGKIGHGRKTF